MRTYVWVGGGGGAVCMCNFIKMYMFRASIQRTEPDYMGRYKLAGKVVDCLLDKLSLPFRGERFLFIHRRV